MAEKSGNLTAEQVLAQINQLPDHEKQKFYKELSELAVKHRKFMADYIAEAKEFAKNFDFRKDTTESQKPYTPDEFAKLTGKHVITIRRWLNDGTLKGNKVGRSWFIPRSELRRIQGEE